MDQYKSCLQVGFNVGAVIKGVPVSVGAGGGSCDGLLNEMGGGNTSLIEFLTPYTRVVPYKSFLCSHSEDTKNGEMVEDFVAVVRGGSSESITALLSQKLPSEQLMKLWGEGVRYNPDFIRMTVSSNCTHKRFMLTYFSCVLLSSDIDQVNRCFGAFRSSIS